MNFRCQRLVATAMAALFSASMLAAESKKTKAEKAKTSTEATTTSEVATNESKSKIDLKVYKLSPTDVVEIKVYREDDMTTKARIAKDGTISFPFLGAINIGGKTVDEARNHIEELLKKDYLVNPQVNVSVLEYAKKWFSVIGEVTRPGQYPIPEEETMDLSRAIASAGGFTRIAKESKVTVTRTHSDGKKEVIPLDLKALERDKKTFEILPGDSIRVHESTF